MKSRPRIWRSPAPMSFTGATRTRTPKLPPRRRALPPPPGPTHRSRAPNAGPAPGSHQNLAPRIDCGLVLVADVARRRHRAAALNRGTLAHGFHPAGEIRQAVEIDAGPFMPVDPRPVRDVRDGVLAAGDILMIGELALEHLEKAAYFALIPVDGVGNLFRRVPQEHIGLAHHRADSLHLEHD